MIDNHCTVHGELALVLQRTSIESKECTITVSAFILQRGVEVFKQSVNFKIGKGASIYWKHTK